MTREQSKRQVLAEYPVAWTVLQMTENSLHPYHLTVYVFILVSLWKKNFMASSDKLWRKARGRHQASMSHVFLPVIMLTTLFGTRRGVSHCSHRSQRIWQKKKLQFCWSSLNFWLKFVWRWSSKFFNFPTVFNTVSGACFFYLIFSYCIFFFFCWSHPSSSRSNVKADECTFSFVLFLFCHQRSSKPSLSLFTITSNVLTDYWNCRWNTITYGMIAVEISD